MVPEIKRAAPIPGPAKPRRCGRPHEGQSGVDRTATAGERSSPRRQAARRLIQVADAASACGPSVLNVVTALSRKARSTGVRNAASTSAAVVVAQAGQMMRQGPDNVRVPGLSRGRWRVAAIHPAEPTFTRSTRERDAVLRSEVAMTADEFVTVGLPLPALKPVSGLFVELEAHPA